MKRSAASLLELIVVLTILGIMAALILPAVQKVRASALRESCANNLRQIGLGIHSAYDARSVLPLVRECPAPWRDGKDLRCETLPSQDYYTGVNEKWWAPYDNRPGTTPTRALPDYAPDSFLWDFVGRDRRLFRCPMGVDRSSGSPTYGEYFQISNALNPDIGGRRRTDPDFPGDLGFEHDDLPVCRKVAEHWTSWNVDANQQADRHDATRHQNWSNVMYKDGSVRTTKNGN